jgi:PAS domain S-box-containing protein
LAKVPNLGLAGRCAASQKLGCVPPDIWATYAWACPPLSEGFGQVNCGQPLNVQAQNGAVMAARPGRKWSELRGEYAEQRELASALRDIATGHGVTLRDLEARMPYGHSSISENLNGAQRPPWRFVVAFLDACTGDDQQARDVLERRIRLLWDAAAPDRARQLIQPDLGDGESSPAQLRLWMGALHKAASSQELVGRLQLSVSRHQAIVSDLLEMMSRLRTAAEALATERDVLREQLRDQAGLAEELRQTRMRLENTQRRLDAGQSLQAETSLRLKEALGQLAEAERLRHEATAQAIAARQRLAEIEQTTVIVVADETADSLAPETDGASLMGETDQALASQILSRVDEALDEEAAKLDDLRSEVSRPDATAPGQAGLSAGQRPTNPTTGPDNSEKHALSDAIRRNSEEVLRRSEERYRSLMQAGAQVVWVTAPTGKIAEDSPDWRAITGQSREEFLSGGWLEAIHPDDRERVEHEWLDCVDTGKVFKDRYRVRTKSGSYRHYDVHAIPIERYGKIVEWVGASSDVTGQREAEEMHGRLTAQLSAAALRTVRLQQATSMLAEAITVEQVVEVMTEVGRSAIGAERSAVAMLDPERLRLRTVNPAGLPDTPGSPAGEMPLDVPSVMTSAILARRPLLIESPDALRKHFEGGADLELFLQHTDERAWVGLPLLVSGAPLGALRFSFTRPRRVGDEERVFLEALAGQCAFGLQRASMFEREHTTAETLQRSLLPDRLPTVPGIILEASYLPVTRNMEIGGDWYDAFRLYDGKLAVAAGDVMGKGLTAAAGMGRVRSALRALALTDPRPAAVLAGLDRLFIATELEEQVATVAYLVLDPTSGDGLAGSAGHLPPLLLSVDAPPHLYEIAGTPLGWASPRQQYPFRLPPGNTAVLYSNGLVTNRRRGLDTGLDELVTAAAQAPAEAIEDPAVLLDYLVDRMMADYEQDDDVTVLVVHRAASPSVPSDESVRLRAADVGAASSRAEEGSVLRHDP